MATTGNIQGTRVAILVSDAFEQVEMTAPRKALDDAGARTTLVSPNSPQVQGWNHHDPAEKFNVDLDLRFAKATDFDALLLPGGVMNPDVLRTIPEAVQFVKDFSAQGKPIAAICHGPWMLVEAGIADGRKMTSWPSLKTDIQNAGGHWVDEVCVEDNNVVTSRKPDDIPKFNETIVALFGRADQKASSPAATTTGTTPAAATNAKAGIH